MASRGSSPAGWPQIEDKFNQLEFLAHNLEEEITTAVSEELQIETVQCIQLFVQQIWSLVEPLVSPSEGTREEMDEKKVPESTKRRWRKKRQRARLRTLDAQAQ